MTENTYLNRDEEEDTDSLSLPALDPLGVLSSTRYVVEQGEKAWINRNRLPDLAATLVAAYPPTSSSTWYERYHFHDGTERTVNWLLVLDALNFCFWAEKGQQRWHIEYHGETLGGYWAEAAALTRAVEEGIPLWDADFLSKISREQLAHIFRSVPASGYTDGAPIPLFEQRLQNVHEVGRVLLQRYDGQFANAIEQADHNAVKLTLLLAQEFPSFNDVTLYRGHEVRFFKRAQICVADLHGAFSGKGWGSFADLDQLTAFADYKVPQVLRHYGVLSYSPSLAARIEAQELLAPGSEEEVEIRAATIWACELLRREIEHLTGHTITAAEVDNRLWHTGQNLAEVKPYHRVRTIYY
ncbi:MAG TPA: queuosine salvage family protein [Ktedonobacteraceae bacterium]|jgi:hypothetical protein|nr:queuosine salvage family protein [Ktedonobacteraceae bacterium]